MGVLSGAFRFQQDAIRSSSSRLSGPHPCQTSNPTLLGFWCQEWLLHWSSHGFRCFKLDNVDTKSQVISDTVEFRHSYLSVPAPSTEDRIIHGLQVVAGALTGASPPTSISQVEAITNL